MSDSDDRIDSPEGGDDLFGDGDSDAASDQEQPLSDHGLDSDHDEGQRYEGDDKEGGAHEVKTKTKTIMRVQLFRHKVPKPHDGTVWA